MSYGCTVCGEHYPGAARDRLGMCASCYRLNFAGAQLPLDPFHPVHDAPCPPLSLTQAGALRLMGERWAEEGRIYADVPPPLRRRRKVHQLWACARAARGTLRAVQGGAPGAVRSPQSPRPVPRLPQYARRGLCLLPCVPRQRADV